LIVLVGVAYGNSLSNGFVYDDNYLIVHNGLITRLDTLPALVMNDYWVARRNPLGVPPFSSGLYRPVVSLTYAMNYAMSGLHPFGYHLLNMVLHLFVSCLVYVLALMLRLPVAAAVAAAALFAVHPIHTEAVTNIIGRAEILMALGVLGSLVLEITGHRRGALVFFALGLFSKEQAVMLPALLMLHYLCFSPRPSGQRGLRQLVQALAKRYGAYGIVLVLYLVIRSMALGEHIVPPISFLENPLASADVYARVLTALKIAGYYVWLCLWPASLSADYSYNSISIIQSVLNIGLILAALGWLCLLGLAIACSRRSEHRVTFCVGLTLIAFLPVSNILLPIGTIMGERLFYVPSIGLCLLAGLGGEWVEMALSRKHNSLAVKPILHGFVTIVLISACITLTGLTVMRNRDWVSAEALFRKAVEVVPTSAKAHALLADELKRTPSPDGRLRALAEYQTALAIYPDYVSQDLGFATNLGHVLLELGRKEEALAAFEKAAALDSRWSTAQYNLGLAYAKLGLFNKAEQCWRTALSLAPDDPQIHSSLSRLALEQGKLEEGLASADTALEKDPAFIMARYNRALALQALGRHEDAIVAYQRVLALQGVPQEAKEDVEAKLKYLRSHSETSHASARRCLPGLAGC
jgi:tetratricopeptide (TPR) repeat protein